jgi:hypothetical protein
LYIPTVIESHNFIDQINSIICFNFSDCFSGNFFIKKKQAEIKTNTLSF